MEFSECLRGREANAVHLDTRLPEKIAVPRRVARNLQQQVASWWRHLQKLTDRQLRVLQITFWNVQQLMDVKRELMPALRRNKAKSATRDAYSAFGAGENSKAARTVQVLLRSQSFMR